MNKLQRYWTERTNITVITGEDIELANKYFNNQTNNNKVTGILEKIQFYREQALEKQFKAWLWKNGKAMRAAKTYPRDDLERENLKMAFANDQFNYDPVKDQDLIDFFKTIVDEKNTYGYHCEFIRLDEDKPREEAIEDLENRIFEVINPGSVVTKEIYWKDVEEELSLNPYVDLSQYPPQEAFVDGVYKEYLKLLPKSIVILGKFTDEELDQLMRDLITYERRHFIRVWHNLTKVMERQTEDLPEEIRYFNSVVYATPYCRVLNQKTYTEQLIQSFD